MGQTCARSGGRRHHVRQTDGVRFCQWVRDDHAGIRIAEVGRASGLDAHIPPSVDVPFGEYSPHELHEWKLATARYEHVHDQPRKDLFRAGLDRCSPVSGEKLAMRCSACARDWHLNDVIVTDDGEPQCPGCFLEGWNNIFPVAVDDQPLDP